MKIPGIDFQDEVDWDAINQRNLLNSEIENYKKIWNSKLATRKQDKANWRKRPDTRRKTNARFKAYRAANYERVREIERKSQAKRKVNEPK